MIVSQESRLEVRKRPLKHRILFQEWCNLLFLHWKYSKEAIQKRLPKGLYVDTFEGDAYLTVVPFFIKNLRLGVLPPLPFLSNFTEINVRTYVYDDKGTPGVYFFSLDINSLIVTQFASKFFHLPYQNSKLTSIITDEKIHISGGRNTKMTISMDIYPSLNSEFICAEPFSLDFFLLERYLLFTSKDNQLYFLQIHHSPYKISNTPQVNFKSNLLEANNFTLHEQQPNIIHYSKHLSVDFFPLTMQDVL